MAVRAAGFIIYRRGPPVAAAGIEYLLMQTSYGAHHWTPPKGHVDPGENDYEAAVRETKEEAGLDEADLDVHGDFKVELNYKVTGHLDGIEREKVVTYWLGRLRDPEGRPVTLSEEHQDFKWLGLEESCRLAQFDTMRKALEQCDSYLKKE